MKTLILFKGSRSYTLWYNIKFSNGSKTILNSVTISETFNSFDATITFHKYLKFLFNEVFTLEIAEILEVL